MRSLVLGLDAAVGRLSGARMPLAALATLADLAGAAAVRLGVAEEERDLDPAVLRDVARVPIPLELRIAPVPTLVKTALETRPARVLLAAEPRARGERAAPLDLKAWGGGLAPAVRTLREAGIRVAVLVLPEIESVKAVHAADVGAVEFDVSRVLELGGRPRAVADEGLGEASRLASKLRIETGLGGGLDRRSAPGLVAIAPVAERITVGRAFLAHSVLVGVDRAVHDLQAAINP